MKPANFETYKSQPDEFKIAQLRTNTSYNKNYVPTPHPFIERLEAYRNVPSLWTRGSTAKGK